ncbi:MAG: hypothetical protein AAFR54_17890 [Planctomycetota bacterium]
MLRALLLVSAAVGLSSPALAQVRARISTYLPAAEEFTIEATLPVPPGTLLEAGGPSPLTLVRNGVTFPTQVEIVSRYPDPADGADVVELIARVQRPAGMGPGAQTDFQVVDASQPWSQFTPNVSVRGLLYGPEGLKLTARDPFNNFYTADLAEQIRADGPDVRVLRNGRHVREVRLHEIMLPSSTSQSGSLSPYPHLFGVHSFVRTYANEDFVVLDLVIHNGVSGREPGPEDDPIHDLYFNQLDLQLPAGWEMGWAFDNPYIGRSNPNGSGSSVAIVDALPTGQYHLLPQQGQFVRRLVVAQGPEALARGQSVLRRETRGFCMPGPTPENAAADPANDIWSWWNAATARYLATNVRLPHLDHVNRGSVIATLRAEHDAFEAQVRAGSSGSYPSQSEGLGWAQPWGVQYGGMTGGDEIYMYPEVDAAWARHPIAIRWMDLRSRAYIDRQPMALYDAKGVPPIVDDFVDTGIGGEQYVPFALNMTERADNDFFGFEGASKRFAQHVYETGKLPWYQKQISGYQPIDRQHLTRFLNPHLGLVWQANDAVAKLQIELAGMLFHASFHPYENNRYGYVAGTGLRERMSDVAENPHQGADFGRGPAWGLIASTSHYAFADDAQRARYQRWLRVVADTARDGQSSCTGNPSALQISRNFKNVYQSRNAREVGFMLNAALAMRSTVFVGVDGVTATKLSNYVVNGAYSCAEAPYWNESVGGQISLIAVRPRANDLPEFCQNTPENGIPNNYFFDHTSAFPAWAYAYLATGDGTFLTRATRAVPGGNLEAALQSQPLVELVEIAPMLSLVQEL